MMLPRRKREARNRLMQMRRLHGTLSGCSASLMRHAAQLRTEISVRWSTGTLADVLRTAAVYAVQTLDGLQLMAVPWRMLTSSIETYIFKCEDLAYGRDDSLLSGRQIDMAAQAMNECGVAVDRVLRLLKPPNSITGKYRWEERPTSPTTTPNGMYDLDMGCIGLTSVFLRKFKIVLRSVAEGPGQFIFVANHRLQVLINVMQKINRATADDGAGQATFFTLSGSSGSNTNQCYTTNELR